MRIGHVMTEIKTPHQLREQVRARYAAAATTVTSGQGQASCGDDVGGCCGPTMEQVESRFGSTMEQAESSFGVGALQCV